MAAIKIKRSSVPAKAPATTDLELGELAVNTYEGKLYLKKNNGTESIVQLANTDAPTFTGTVKVDKLEVASPGGDEGGEINLALAATNNLLSGSVAIDINQSQLRIFETGGSNRGVYINLASAGVGVSTNLLASGGGGPSLWAKKTANYTAVSGDKILADTTAGTFTVTLPASPVLGDTIIIADAGSWQTTNLTVGRNGSTIEAATEDLVLDIPNIQVEFVYDGTTWEVYAFTGPSGVDVSDDTATNATVYPSWVSTTSGNQAVKTSSTKLYFNPSTGQFNATDFNSLSDANKKKDIQTIKSAVSLVGQLRGVTFNWRDTNQAAVGVIAQEVENVLPQVVSTATTGEKSVSYGNIVAVLIEAVKEQQQEINALKQKLGV